MPDDPQPRQLLRLTKRISLPDRDKNGVRWSGDIGVWVDRPDAWRWGLALGLLDFNLDSSFDWTHIYLLWFRIGPVEVSLGARDTN